MYAISYAILLLVLTKAFVSVSGAWRNNETENISICPTWYLLDNNNTCKCGDTADGKVKCFQEKEQVAILSLACITNTDDNLLVGDCPYIRSGSGLPDKLYTKVPENVSDVNEFMCGFMNRTGLLCSQCQEGLSLAALSYQRTCIECSNPTLGITIFVVIVVVPTTLFFFLVMVCSIDISSGPMNAALILIQIFLARINRSLPGSYFENLSVYYYVLSLVTFYGIWNLDFFRYLIPPFCIGKSLTSLQSEALEYVIATYPLLLIVLTYICVELYDNGYKLIIALWSPFKALFDSKCFKELNVRYSLIKAFATFLVLSYTKILHTSRALLIPSILKNASGDTVKTVLFIDASTSYQSTAHIPYMGLSIFMLVTFNLLPLLLLLFYPMKWFQLLLGKFPDVNWHPLHAFMDIFQGCYKNGTNGTRDYRYFAAASFIGRITALLPINDPSLSLLRDNIQFLVVIVLIAIARPYQNDAINILEISLYSMFAVMTTWSMYSIFITPLPHLIIHASSFTFLFYICFLYVAKALKTFAPRRYEACAERFKRWMTGNTIFPCCCFSQEANDADFMEKGGLSRSVSCTTNEEYPDRLNNPQDYQPLLGSKSASQLLSQYTYGSTTPFNVACKN